MHRREDKCRKEGKAKLWLNFTYTLVRAKYNYYFKDPNVFVY
jgi:hypothetical protein